MITVALWANLQSWIVQLKSIAIGLVLMSTVNAPLESEARYMIFLPRCLVMVATWMQLSHVGR